MAILEVISGPTAGQRYELTRNETVLGRYSFCDIVLPTHSISRQHARIVCSGDSYYLEDLNSLNGTFVNGQRVKGRWPLQDQDRVHIYEVEAVFHENEVHHRSLTRDRPQVEPSRLPVAAADQPSESGPRAETIVNTLNVAAGPRVDVHAREKLRAVLEITRSLGSSLKVDEVLQKILDGLFAVFPQSERGQILIAESPEGPLRPRALKQGTEKTNLSPQLGPISRTIADRVMSQGEAILSADVFNDEELQVSEFVLDFPIRSMMCAPLIGPSRQPLGIVYVDTNDPENRFEEEDLEVLLSVAIVAGQAVEYAQVHEARLLLDRQQRELAMAKQVQLHFLPQRRPLLTGYRFYDHYRSAQQVGGDYYSYVPLREGRLAIAMGDVAGKGVSAALLMARLCSDVRYCLATSPTPEQALRQLNLELAQPAGESHLVTFCLCVLDPGQHTLTILNAGHMPPLCRRARRGTVEVLGSDARGLPLGIDLDSTATPYEVRLEPGDLVVMYTDGINDAMNQAGQFYGQQRLLDLLAAGPEDPSAWGESLLGELDQFLGDRPQNDDICLICFSRLGDLLE